MTRVGFYKVDTEAIAFALDGVADAAIATDQEVLAMGYLPLYRPDSCDYDIARQYIGNNIDYNESSAWYVILDKSLAVVKSEKLQAVLHEFALAPSFGAFVLNSSFKMDATREDVDNLSNLATFMTATGGTDSTEVTIRDFNNEYHVVTLLQLKTILIELIGNGLSLFQRKWTAEAAIANASTVADVIAVEF